MCLLKKYDLYQIITCHITAMSYLVYSSSARCCLASYFLTNGIPTSYVVGVLSGLQVLGPWIEISKCQEDLSPAIFINTQKGKGAHKEVLLNCQITVLISYLIFIQVFNFKWSCGQQYSWTFYLPANTKTWHCLFVNILIFTWMKFLLTIMPNRGLNYLQENIIFSFLLNK